MTPSLRSYRTKHHVSLGQFGDVFGVDKSTVHRWEGGRIPAERVLAVSKHTGIPPHALRPDIYLAPSRARAS